MASWKKQFGESVAQSMFEWLGDHLLSYIFDRETFVPHPEKLLLAERSLSRGTPFFRCTKCGTAIVSGDEIISSRDTAGIFQSETKKNPHGSVFCFLKVRKVLPGATQEFWKEKNMKTPIRQESEPRLNDTWFPDYAWSLMFCAKCETHIGWKFRLYRDSQREQPLFDLLIPEFFGLVHERLTAGSTTNAATGAHIPGVKIVKQQQIEPPKPKPEPILVIRQESTKRCGSCQTIKVRSDFTRKQWSTTEGRCNQCL